MCYPYPARPLRGAEAQILRSLQTLPCVVARYAIRWHDNDDLVGVELCLLESRVDVAVADVASALRCNCEEEADEEVTGYRLDHVL